MATRSVSLHLCHVIISALEKCSLLLFTGQWSLTEEDMKLSEGLHGANSSSQKHIFIFSYVYI